MFLPKFRRLGLNSVRKRFNFQKLAFRRSHIFYALVVSASTEFKITSPCAGDEVTYYSSNSNEVGETVEDLANNVVSSRNKLHWLQSEMLLDVYIFITEGQEAAFCLANLAIVRFVT